MRPIATSAVRPHLRRHRATMTVIQRRRLSVQKNEHKPSGGKGGRLAGAPVLLGPAGGSRPRSACVVLHTRGDKRQWWLVIARRSRGSGATVNVAKGSVITALQSAQRRNVKNVAIFSAQNLILQGTYVHTRAKSPLCVKNVAKLSATAAILQSTCVHTRAKSPLCVKNVAELSPTAPLLQSTCGVSTHGRESPTCAVTRVQYSILA